MLKLDRRKKWFEFFYQMIVNELKDYKEITYALLKIKIHQNLKWSTIEEAIF